VRFSPTQGKYKVYIIDEVHMLTDYAFNALLKTLEEPPAHSKFILATTELHKVPTTILSRCQRFQFRRIPIQVIVDHLKQILSQQTALEFASPAELDRILYHLARASEGGLRDALVSLDQLLAFCSGKLQLSEVEEILGVIEFDLQDRFVRSILHHDLAAILMTIEEVINRGNEIGWFLKECMQFLRNLAVSKVTKETRDLIDMPDDYRIQLQETAKSTSIEQILYITDAFWEAERRLRFSNDARLILEMASFKAAKAGQAIKVEEILSKISSGSFAYEPPTQPQIATTPQPAAEKAQIPTPDAPPVQQEPTPQAEPKQPEQPPVHAEEATPPPLEPEPMRPDEGSIEPEPALQEPTTIEATEPSASTLDSAWNQILNEVEKTDPVIAAALHNTKAIEFTDDTLKVAIPQDYKYNLRMLELPHNRMALTTLVKDNFGRKLHIVYEISSDLTSSEEIQSEAKSEPAPAIDTSALFNKVQENEIFNRLQDELPGRILKIQPE
jgi:DNA polymerase III subunit gamma/tau